MTNTKRCRTCKEEKAPSEFNKDRTKSDGLQNQCRVCQRERQRKYREENREALLEYQHKYREENREEIQEKNRKYREENREALREYQRKYREGNAEYLREIKCKGREESQRLTKHLATKIGRYTAEEEKFIIDNLYRMTILDLALELGRTHGSVDSKVNQLRKKGIIQ